MVWKNICKIITALTVVLVVCDSASAHVDDIEPRVDERSELLSIVFHLAGAFEYNQTKLQNYQNDIEKCFAPYENDPVIVLADKLHQNANLGYDAPMVMAVSLSSPPGLIPVVPVPQDPLKRWTEKSASEFADKLQKFYIRSKFHDFYTAHRTLYNLTENKFRDLAGKFDQSWFNRFYGAGSAHKFNLILSLVNGAYNYGAAVSYPDGKKELFAVVGCGKTDKTGNPSFTQDDLTRVVDIFSDYIVDPIVNEHGKEFACAQPVVDAVTESMLPQAYPPISRIMVSRSLSRAGAIMYTEAAGADARQIRDKILEAQSIGFVWMDELYERLRQYQSERSRYPTLEEFMPKIVEFYKALAPRIKEKLAAYDKQCPHVAGTEPMHNHSDSVDAGTGEIIVHFDKALDPQHNQAVPTRPGEHYPVVKSEFLPGNKSLKLTVKLKEHCNYEIGLLPQNFRAPDGYRLVSYKLQFTTK